MKKARKLPILKAFISMGCLWAFQASAQQTYRAASCSQADVQTAIRNELAHPADGDIISIPACPPTAWTTAISQAFNNSITIQGAGAVSSAAGGAGTTGTDQTVLINHITTHQGLMSFKTIAGKSIRVTGIAFEEDSGTPVQVYGNLVIAGLSTAVRVDHCHFEIAFGGGKGLYFSGGVNGVADHIYVHTTQLITNNFVFEDGGTWNGDTGGYGNGSWADGDHFGSSRFMFVEDSLSDGGYVGDCSLGGRYVLRHMTAINGQGQIGHGTHNEYRGCRAAEVYQINQSNPSSGGAHAGGVLNNDSGTQIAWGNTVTNFNSIIGTGYYRITGVPYGSTAVPSGWGMCGNVTNGPSVWDQNLSTNGYACLDQPARGKGDLISNLVTSFSDVINTVTGTRTWPHQILSPIYVWGNSLGLAGQHFVGVGGNLNLADNSDYYQDFGTYGEPGSFNGTTGVGSGLLSARPATCTAGPGGNAPGVGYWATDVPNPNDANHPGVLYVCNPTNTWTVYYAPYTYPHPLTGSSSATTATVAPPTSLTATVQ